MIRVGVIGLSEGNGHPFSFAAILNGFDPEGMQRSGWPVIHQYLSQRRPEEFGIEGVKVTHAWTQDPETTQRLCAATRIAHPCPSLEAMLGEVDAVLLARDDYPNHVEMALPFLKRGIPVFIDKPLCLTEEHWQIFRPFLASGKAMSCSGMRFAGELDSLGESLKSIGGLRFLRGTVVNAWAKYGIHLIDAVSPFLPSPPRTVTPLPAMGESVLTTLENGVPFPIQCLGAVPKTFQLEFWGERGRAAVDIADNFTAFRRTLVRFFESLQRAEPALPLEDTERSMRWLIAGARALALQKEVSLDSIRL